MRGCHGCFTAVRQLASLFRIRPDISDSTSGTHRPFGEILSSFGVLRQDPSVVTSSHGHRKSPWGERNSHPSARVTPGMIMAGKLPKKMERTVRPLAVNGGLDTALWSIHSVPPW